jgi:hypothetical protein
MVCVLDLLDFITKHFLTSSTFSRSFTTCCKRPQNSNKHSEMILEMLRVLLMIHLLQSIIKALCLSTHPFLHILQAHNNLHFQATLQFLSIWLGIIVLCRRTPASEDSIMMAQYSFLFR